MIRIAHLSDIHFGAHLPALVGPLIEDIASFAPDAIAISGDLTQRARQLEFEAAAAFIATLPAPVVAVPGNHDIPARALFERMFDPRRRWRRFISQTTEPVVMLPGLALIGLDTVRRAQPHLDWSAGGVSAARLARLASRIEAAGERRVVVVAHHPLRHPPMAPGRARPLGAGAALAMMGRAGVCAVLSGHLHRSAPIPGSPPVVICGSTLSHRVQGVPNGWTLIELDEDGPPLVRQRIAEGLTWRDAAPTGSEAA
ncbi:metallophosphoesterase family protein [Neoroseomonas lacus]|uniref:Phosphodiesterase n=1 Tax=Neoroseomonas lacus TaxID=287609 RepID=A0A917KJZ8_9PROT|nr:metallophosphoesterase [Neoroseomonas lacus]GGJ17553.1 phosphodiesterase [Neoroseomonas lacus]